MRKKDFVSLRGTEQKLQPEQGSNFCTPQIPHAEAKPQNITLQISAVQYKGDCTVHKS